MNDCYLNNFQVGFVMRPQMLIAGLIWCLSGCGSPPEPGYTSLADAVVMTSIPGETRVLRIRVPVEGIISGTLDQEQDIGGPENGFGAILDLAALPDGVAVLDRTESSIRIFDFSGKEVRRIGRNGSGPGEFTFPMAMAANDSVVVVTQLPRQTPNIFTVLRTNGEVIATSDSPVPGDWVTVLLRDPKLRVEGVQRGPEDMSLRLNLSEEGVYYLVEPDERQMPDTAARTAHLIRLSYDLRRVDTIQALPGTTTRFAKVFAGPGLSKYEQPLYTGRPVWALGDDWIATGHGDSAELVIRKRTNGITLLKVRSEYTRAAVTDEERETAATWILALQSMNSLKSNREMREASWREVREAIRGTAFDLTSFATEHPFYTALYGVQNCLFIEGFSPQDHPSGSSLKWLVVDVKAGKPERTISITPNDVRSPMLERGVVSVKAIDRTHMYAIYRNNEGLSFVRRYRVPELACMEG